jgi:hypothetical protein
MRWILRAVTFALLLSGGVLTGGLSSPPLASSTTSQFGPAHHHFLVDFPSAPSVQTVHFGASQFQRQYGTGITRRVIYKAKLTVVFVNILSTSVPAQRVSPYLRSFLPTPRGGRVIEWHNLPAATEFVPGCDPSGQCNGVIGSLVVLDGKTVYDLFTTQSDATKAHSVINSFRLLP